MGKQKTAVIYARFSSDLQRDRSIDDQVTLCEQIARREGYRVIEVFSDRAKSGASMFERDGLLALMTAAKKRAFDGVISESLSRLSRDPEDTAAIFKRLRFNDITIFDQNGAVTDIHASIGGIVNSMFLKNLADNVRRHHSGRAREGKFPGALTYGYRCIPGKPGEREIDEEQAAIVRRIFAEYADGKPARQIAADLTRGGIPSPGGGKHWNHQTFVGGMMGRRGMLGNRLYVGEIVWNSNRTIRNPETGKRTQRKANPDDQIVTSVPHLRIIDQGLWDRVHALCDQRASRFGHDRRVGVRRGQYKDHLLSGMLCCGACGGNMRVYQVTAKGGGRVACAAAIQKGTCAHRKSYYLSGLEAAVLDGMKANLANPKALIEYARAYHARWAERQREISADRAAAEKQLNKLTVQIDRYVTAIGESDEPVKPMMERLNKLEAERAALAARLDATAAESNVIALHPAAIDKLASNVEVMHAALSDATRLGADPAKAARYRSAFRSLFDRFLVHPTPRRHAYEVTPIARLSVILGVDLFPKNRNLKEMLAEQGVTMPLVANETIPT
ncbi:recombinase family protein [Bradyrhizobium elkanii]|uniref:recombinase family protein n=1 Tax=Bradyrhizobium elkanii TaxID=29448 RepID=UPI000841FDFD|nr:recombinase family protein [Bradyrhizobium elkanii]ODM79933.1 hypothetical protein A6452_24255 [Bradyrhizobium elkanii]